MFYLNSRLGRSARSFVFVVRIGGDLRSSLSVSSSLAGASEHLPKTVPKSVRKTGAGGPKGLKAQVGDGLLVHSVPLVSPSGRSEASWGGGSEVGPLSPRVKGAEKLVREGPRWKAPPAHLLASVSSFSS